MKFQDPDVQKEFDKGLEEAKGWKVLNRGLSEDDLRTLVLISMYFWFLTTEYGESAKTQDIIDHLLSVELRPALRSYFQRRPGAGGAVFAKFRDHLSDLAGERFA